MTSTSVNLSNNKLYKLFDESSKHIKNDKNKALRIVVDKLKDAYNRNSIETEMLKQEKCTKFIRGNTEILKKKFKLKIWDKRKEFISCEKAKAIYYYICFLFLDINNDELKKIAEKKYKSHLVKANISNVDSEKTLDIYKYIYIAQFFNKINQEKLRNMIKNYKINKITNLIEGIRYKKEFRKKINNIKENSTKFNTNTILNKINNKTTNANLNNLIKNLTNSQKTEIKLKINNKIQELAKNKSKNITNIKNLSNSLVNQQVKKLKESSKKNLNTVLTTAPASAPATAPVTAPASANKKIENIINAITKYTTSLNYKKNTSKITNKRNNLLEIKLTELAQNEFKSISNKTLSGLTTKRNELSTKLLITPKLKELISAKINELTAEEAIRKAEEEAEQARIAKEAEEARRKAKEEAEQARIAKEAEEAEEVRIAEEAKQARLIAAANQKAQENLKKIVNTNTYKNKLYIDQYKSLEDKLNSIKNESNSSIKFRNLILKKMNELKSKINNVDARAEEWIDKIYNLPKKIKNKQIELTKKNSDSISIKYGLFDEAILNLNSTNFKKIKYGNILNVYDKNKNSLEFNKQVKNRIQEIIKKKAENFGINLNFTKNKQSEKKVEIVGKFKNHINNEIKKILADSFLNFFSSDINKRKTKQTKLLNLLKNIHNHKNRYDETNLNESISKISEGLFKTLKTQDIHSIITLKRIINNKKNINVEIKNKLIEEIDKKIKQMINVLTSKTLSDNIKELVVLYNEVKKILENNIIQENNKNNLEKFKTRIINEIKELLNSKSKLNNLNLEQLKNIENEYKYINLLNVNVKNKFKKLFENIKTKKEQIYKKNLMNELKTILATKKLITNGTNTFSAFKSTSSALTTNENLKLTKEDIMYIYVYLDNKDEIDDLKKLILNTIRTIYINPKYFGVNTFAHYKLDRENQKYVKTYFENLKSSQTKINSNVNKKKEALTILGLNDKLELNKVNTIEIIKKQYKNLALQYHPNKQTGKTSNQKKEAENKFKEIVNAYGILTE